MSELRETFLTVGKLKDILSTCENDDLEAKVLLALPSIGAQAFTRVTGAGFGFDWDKGLLLATEQRLVPKEEKQDIFEWAYDLLMFLATEGLTKKRKRYENRQAERILGMYGVSHDDLKKYVRLFHRGKTVIQTDEVG